MGGCRVLGQAWGGWRRGLGIRATPTAAGFGTKARHQLQRRGASKPSDPPGDQCFPGLLRPGTFSREELVDVLRAAVVDRKGPLVTLNKPQGLPVTGKPGELTLLSVLPELSQSLGLGEQELQVVRASGKEASGLVLLSSCPQTASRLQKFFAHSQRARRPTATYCAVTDGIPVTSEGKIQAALKLEHIDGVNLVVPVQSPSRKDIMEGVKRTLSHFRVVATGSGCALVQLQPLTEATLHGSKDRILQQEKGLWRETKLGLSPGIFQMSTTASPRDYFAEGGSQSFSRAVFKNTLNAPPPAAVNGQLPEMSQIPC
uniref:RNA pseudouridine synthase D3 n=1 Tax=Ovis aries TaxID=9940 RepID=A0AC11EM28_SHEEP